MSETFKCTQYFMLLMSIRCHSAMVYILVLKYKKDMLAEKVSWMNIYIIRPHHQGQ